MDVEIDHFGGQSGCELGVTHCFAISHHFMLLIVPSLSYYIVHMGILLISYRVREFIIFMAAGSDSKLSTRFLLALKGAVECFLYNLHGPPFTYA